MTGSAATGRLRGDLWRRGRLAALFAIIAALAASAAALGWELLRGALPVGGLAPTSLILAAGVYLTGHLFRVLRLALLIGGWRVGFRRIAAFHFTSAAISLLAPLKLGELYRIAELGGMLADGVRGLMIVWWERVFDAGMLMAVLVAAFLLAPNMVTGAFATLGALIGLFLLFTAVVFFVLPDNLRRLSVLIIRRYESAHTVGLLRELDRLRHAILGAPWMVKAKLASLITLSGLIWLCELIALIAVLPMVGGVLAAVRSLAEVLSAIVGGSTLLQLLAQAAPRGPACDYLVVTQGPLLGVGLLAALAYLALLRQR